MIHGNDREGTDRRVYWSSASLLWAATIPVTESWYGVTSGGQTRHSWGLHSTAYPLARDSYFGREWPRWQNFHPSQGNHCFSQEHKWIPLGKRESWDRWTVTYIIYVKMLKIRPENAIAKLIWMGQAGLMRRLAEDGMCIMCNLTQAAGVWRHQLSYPLWMHRKHWTWFNRTIWIKRCWSLFFTRPLLIVFFLWTFPSKTVTKTQQNAISSSFCLWKEKHCSSVGLIILAGIKSLPVFNQILLNFLKILLKWGKGYATILKHLGNTNCKKMEAWEGRGQCPMHYYANCIT